MDSSSEFLDWEAVFLQVFVNLLEEDFGHFGSAVEDPQIVVIWATDNRVAVTIVQSHNPVIGLNVKSCAEFYFKFGVAVFCVIGVGESLSN